jgi:alpha-1,3-glucosyltransferase
LYPSVLLIVNKLFKLKTKPISSKIEDSAYKLSELDTDSLVALLLVLLNPTLVLIDHGHFQYNGISLGLTQLAIFYLFKSRDVRLKFLMLASFLFAASLNYKQMELYHALPFFFYLLGLCLFKSGDFKTWLVNDY